MAGLHPVPSLQGHSQQSAVDEWYIDDGQAFVPPFQLEHWLRAFDIAVGRFGGTRGTVAAGTAKSSCRLICPPARRAEFDGWDTEYVRSTCKVLGPDDAAVAQGVVFGHDGEMQASVAGTVQKSAEIREAIGEIDDAATELGLTRQCADVSRLLYHLRLNGDRVQDGHLEKFDCDLKATLEGITGGDLHDLAWSQASMGVQHGGLGLRQAGATSLAAFVSSRYASRPHVQEMVGHVSDAGMGGADDIMQVYDNRTLDAAFRLIESLPSEVGLEIIELLDGAWDATKQSWEDLFRGDGGVGSSSGGLPTRHLGSSILPSDGDGDSEHPETAGHCKSMKLQRDIMIHIDGFNRDRLRGQFQEIADEPSLRRLDELSHADVDHSWMWSLSRHRGPKLSNAEFVEAIRIRLGVAGPAEPVACTLCGGVFDSAGSHAACCAIAEATRGHHAAAAHLHSTIQRCDPGAEKEVSGLIPGTDLRPADVLTSCIDGGLTALDIGITSPDAQYAGSDCVQSMYERKVAKYARYQAALDRQNISYQPVVFSCYGRPHGRATAILRTLSKRVARRRGCSDARMVYQGLRKAMSVEIWRRVAKQCQSCWPDDGQG